MTTDEREGIPHASSTHVPNLEAQRAYAATIAPPPRPPLPPEQTGRVRLAGGLGGAMMLVGVDVVVLGVLLLALPLAIGSLARWLGGVLPGVDAAAAGSSVEQLYAGPWPWIAALVLAAGAVLATLGTVVSVRILRAAGVERPVRLTFAAFGIGLGARVVLNIFTAPFSSLLAPLLERGLAGIEAGGAELVGTVVALVIACAMNAAIAAATGMLAWWFVAHVSRPAEPEPEPEEPAWSSLPRHHRMPH